MEARNLPLVMIVEDEFIVALDLTELTTQAGFGVAGPHPSLRSAMSALDDAVPDCALLDVQLVDGEVYPLADRLNALGIPLIFHSGHAQDVDLLQRYPGAITSTKPTDPALLIAFINQQLAQPLHRTGSFTGPSWGRAR